MLGVQPHIAEAALNHLPAKLIRTYDRNTYAAEKRAALDAWGSHLSVAVAQASGANVTKLERKDLVSSNRARPSRSRSRLSRWRLISSALSDTPSSISAVCSQNVAMVHKMIWLIVLDFCRRAPTEPIRIAANGRCGSTRPYRVPAILGRQGHDGPGNSV